MPPGFALPTELSMGATGEWFVETEANSRSMCYWGLTVNAALESLVDPKPAQLDPNDVWFTQDSISAWFQDGRSLVDVINQLAREQLGAWSLPPMEVVWHENGPRASLVTAVAAALRILALARSLGLCAQCTVICVARSRVAPPRSCVAGLTTHNYRFEVRDTSSGAPPPAASPRTHGSRPMPHTLPAITAFTNPPAFRSGVPLPPHSRCRAKSGLPPRPPCGATRGRRAAAAALPSPPRSLARLRRAGRSGALLVLGDDVLGLAEPLLSLGQVGGQVVPLGAGDQGEIRQGARRAGLELRTRAEIRGDRGELRPPAAARCGPCPTRAA